MQQPKKPIGGLNALLITSGKALEEETLKRTNEEPQSKVQIDESIKKESELQTPKSEKKVAPKKKPLQEEIIQLFEGFEPFSLENVITVTMSPYLKAKLKKIAEQAKLVTNENITTHSLLNYITTQWMEQNKGKLDVLEKRYNKDIE